MKPRNVSTEKHESKKKHALFDTAKKSLTSLFLSLLIFLPSLPTVAAEAPPSGTSLLSPAMEIIAGECPLVKSTSPRREAVFTAEDFDLIVGNDVKTITLTKRPDESVGQLLLGSTVVPVGQKLTSAALSRLAFVPSDAVSDGEQTVFRFTADGSPYEFACYVGIYSDSDNAPPSVTCATEASLRATAYTDCACGGLLAGEDPDGDELTYIITSYPRHGGVVLQNAAVGSYLYTPLDGYTGKDDFSYTVRDSRGNFAASEAKVTLTVSRHTANVDFSDVAGGDKCNAITAVSAGVMSGKQMGDLLCFDPDGSVSRAELLVALMSAAGIRDLPDVASTPFDDDGDIPAAIKPYVAAAYELGYTSGWIKNGLHTFSPDECVTAAEAAVMTAAILSLPSRDAVPASVGDGIPSWAKSALSSLTAAGISLGERGDVSASTLLDRRGAASLVCAVIRCSN